MGDVLAGGGCTLSALPDRDRPERGSLLTEADLLGPVDAVAPALLGCWLVTDRPERLFHVGRLDTDTSGLLILTNDGDFAQRLAHPSYEVDKTYVAEVEGEVHKGTLKQLLAGVSLDDGPVTVSSARVVSGSHGRNAHDRTIVELVIHEGRNRIVRRLLDHVGHPVTRLTRTQIGPVSLGRLPVGEMRELSLDELGDLMDSAQL